MADTKRVPLHTVLLCISIVIIVVDILLVFLLKAPLIKILSPLIVSVSFIVGLFGLMIGVNKKG